MLDPYSTIVNASRDYITMIDRGFRYVFVNDSYARVLGKSREELEGRTVAEVWGQARFEGSIEVPLRRCFEGEQVNYIDEFPFGESVRYVEVSYHPFREQPTGPVTQAIVVSHDITRLGQLETRLMAYEFRDPATGFFNRRSLDIILEREIEKAKNEGPQSIRGLLLLAVENLGEIRRQHGSEVAGVVLENTGLRIKEELKDGDFIFLYESEELAILLGGLESPLEAVSVGERLLAVADMPYPRGEYEIHPVCRAGAALFPRDADDKDPLMNRAAAALAGARDAGRPLQLYDGELHARAIEKRLLGAQMRKALYDERFELHYQPLVDVRGRIVGAEGLLRWRHPDKGLLPPSVFIPLAEETGLIVELEKRILFEAARWLARWDRFGIYISINLSARLFESPQLTDLLDTAMKQAGEAGSDRLKLEITESEGLRNPEAAVRQMKALRRRGFDIYIDDFGTGQSSLHYLKDLPATALKIDRAFVTGIESDDECRRYLRGIVDLIRTKDRKVVIEGVENAAQAEILAGMGADALQGFWYSRPIPGADLETLLISGLTLPLKNGG